MRIELRAIWEREAKQIGYGAASMINQSVIKTASTNRQRKIGYGMAQRFAWENRPR
jgi:hypothetical protein